METNKKPVQKKDRTWGIGIAVFYSLFVLVTLGLVFFATLQRFDLVADSYYEDGVKYQDRIDQMELANSSQFRLDFGYDDSSKKLRLAFPEEISSDSISGKVILFRPSNASLDRSWELDPGLDRSQVLDLRELRHGSWKAMVYWKAGSVDLYSEHSLFIER